MPTFKTPIINLYSHDLPRALAFYLKVGFLQTFRTPETGDPIHVELALDDFRLGIAALEAAQADNGITPSGDGRWVEIVLWTDDADKAARELVEAGAKLLSPPRFFLDGTLKAAWVADPGGNPVQLVQKVS